MNPAPTPVRIVGRYALYGAIASGGMATVHFGRLIGPVGFSRTVAIKRLHAQFATDPEFVAMFLDEARLAARIRHPNVVPTLDVVSASGELFLVMEYVPGESLARLIRAARERNAIVPTNITVSIMVGVLHGLHAAHEAKNEHGAPLGIVHRDVSPQNVLVGADGQARVLDFGVAKAAGRVQTTREGQLKGKLAYMAPEQLRGEELTRQTDIYAASVVLWEALTNERLFRGDNEGAVVTRVLDGMLLPPSRAVNPMVDAAAAQDVARLDAITMRGLARDQRTRFATARDMALALEKAVQPATASEVSDWLEGVAAEVLRKRAGQVAEIESSSAALQRVSGAIAILPHELTRPDTSPDSMRATDVSPPAAPEASSAALSSISVSANSPKSDSGAVGKRRRTALAVAGLGMLLLVPLAALVVLRAYPASPVGSGSPGATAASSTVTTPRPASSSAPSASTDEPAPSPIKPAASSSAKEEAKNVPVPAPPASSPAPTQKRTQPARPSCNPPFTYDGAGMKHYKPECL